MRKQTISYYKYKYTIYIVQLHVLSLEFKTHLIPDDDKGSYIKDLRKILAIFDPPPSLSAAVRIEPTPLSPGRLASAIHIHKEKISTSTILLIFCGI